MRQTIAKLLVFFILSANLAWIADMDEVRAATEPGKVLLAGDQPDEDGSGHAVQDSTPCDHSGHESAHYFGLLPDPLSFRPKSDHAVRSPRLTALRSRDQAPPLRPPKI
ncbi:hypothetical protein BMS3Bbin12_00245 [bacterium BMS3Bbin12]|nr:hypothetical protein BMS3Abin12_00803 [bacterium BMS3Abin12]GBE47091.1 hypothetical protein BMS3Bbin12_00245 [bacterium BMS3Bbin12]GBE51026.1 hypothetical protein BMS3Bbin13_01979 [bacterium BMS3Bbin13]